MALRLEITRLETRYEKWETQRPAEQHEHSHCYPIPSLLNEAWLCCAVWPQTVSLQSGGIISVPTKQA